MNITNLFKVSLKAVANNKMRSFLSMLGIIIGVAPADHPSGSRYAWWCAPGPLSHADFEDGRL